jgi:hypothetical protein
MPDSNPDVTTWLTKGEHVFAKTYIFLSTYASEYLKFNLFVAESACLTAHHYKFILINGSIYLLKLISYQAVICSLLLI